MGEVTLVLGGSRSGKSRFAENLVLKTMKHPIYIATAKIHDEEMHQRIKIHRRCRNSVWKTLEAPLDLVQTIVAESSENRAILVDCLTLWLSNLLVYDYSVEIQCDRLVCLLKKACSDIVLVSSEVGLGIVPDNRLAREFRDYAGRLNQAVAAVAHGVYFVAAGLPLKLKG